MQIKENIKAPRLWPLCGEFTGDRWIPRTNGQLRGKCFHLMTSSWTKGILRDLNLIEVLEEYLIIQYPPWHYSDVIMSAMASETTGVAIVYSTVSSGADQWKHRSPASLSFVRGIHRWPVNSPYKRPVTLKMFLFDDVVMALLYRSLWMNGAWCSSWGHFVVYVLVMGSLCCLCVGNGVTLLYMCW